MPVYMQASLDARIADIYTFLDCDGGGALSKTELTDGLRRLKLQTPIALSDDDWLTITEHEALCNADGELDAEHFALVLKEQLKAHMLTDLVRVCGCACVRVCVCACVRVCVCECVRV